MSHGNNGSNYVIVVEHDLSVLDYLSDLVCVLYGNASAYGVVTMPMSVRVGINCFLDGFIESENMRFRDQSLSFKIRDNLEEELAETQVKIFQHQYPEMTKKFNGFQLDVTSGEFSNQQIIVLLGENGTGKTTLVRILAGFEKDLVDDIPELNVSYKPQKLTAKFEGTVRELLWAKIKNPWETNILFKTHVFK